MSVARINDIITGWKTWRYVASTGDTLPTTWPPSQHTTDQAAGKVISIKPYTHIIMRMFGVGGATDEFSYTVYGYMNPVAGSRSSGPGPGWGLATGACALNSHTITDEKILDDKFWPSATTFQEATITTSGGIGTDHTNVKTGTLTGNTMLVLNCVGFTRLSLWIHDFVDNGGAISSAGVIYRPFSFVSPGGSA